MKNINQKNAFAKSTASRKTLTAKNRKLDKQAGFSLQGMLIASLIGAILAGATIASLWQSVDKATITAEAQSISAFKNAVTGILEANGSFPSSLDAATDTVALQKISQVPKELKYQLVLMEGATTAASDNWIGLKAYAYDTKGKDRLVTMVAEMDNKYDSTVAGSETPTAGKFVYSLTCSAPGTVATSQTDCYYVTPLLAKTAMPTDIGDASTIAGTVSGGTVGTNGYNTAVAAGVSTDLN